MAGVDHLLVLQDSCLCGCGLCVGWRQRTGRVCMFACKQWRVFVQWVVCARGEFATSVSTLGKHSCVCGLSGQGFVWPSGAAEFRRKAKFFCWDQQPPSPALAQSSIELNAPTPKKGTPVERAQRCSVKLLALQPAHPPKALRPPHIQYSLPSSRGPPPRRVGAPAAAAVLLPPPPTSARTATAAASCADCSCLAE